MTVTTIYLYIIRFLRLTLGVLSLSLISRFYGVSEQRDFWIFAISIISAIELFFFGPINETFRSKFIEIIKKSGEKKALEIISILFVLISLIISVLLLITYFNPSIFNFFLAKAINIKNSNTYLSFFMLLLPIILINQSISVLISVLNVYEKVLTPEFIYLLSSLVNILIIYFLASTFGLYALVISIYSSSLFILIYLIFKTYNLGIRFSFSLSFSSINQLFDFLKFSFPLYLPYAIGQISSIFEKFLIGSIGIGSLSIIDYSRKICDTLNTLNSGIILTLFVPVLSKLNFEKRLVDYNFFFNKQFERGLILVVLIVSVLISTSTNIVDILYNHGKLSIDSLNQIKSLTLLYSIAIFSVYVYSYTGYALIATGKTKSYSFFTSVNQILIIFLVFIGSDKFGIFIFPVVMGLIHLIIGILMLFKSSPNFGINFKIIGRLIILIICNYLLGLILKSQIYSYSNYVQIAILVLGCLFGIFVYLIIFKIRSLKNFREDISAFTKNV